MKHLRMTNRPDVDVVPPIFGLIADSEHVREARMLGWNTSNADRPTALFAVDGDLPGFRGDFEPSESIAAADLTSVAEDRFYLLLTLDASSSPAIRDLFDILTSDGLVVIKPVVYRDGAVHANVVGDAATLQAAMERLPPFVDVEIDEIGSYDGGPDAPAAKLSERQRDAVLAALERGYYDTPRRATHDDVAEAIGIAPSTASEHLQKAESKLVRSTLAPYRD
ncbi:MAG: putative DNA binding protein [Halobacteriales archaeon]|jgi:predicted DNA binding protein